MTTRTLTPALQIEILLKRFDKLNPFHDPQEIDWSAVLDKTATFAENLENFKNEYPHYNWEEKNDPYYFQALDSLKDQAKEFNMDVVDKGLMNRLIDKNGRLEAENAKLFTKMREQKLVEKKPKSENLRVEPVSDSLRFIDKIIDDFHEVNIVMNAVNGHGKSSSLRTIIGRLKERYPHSIVKIFDISQAWFHVAPVKHRQRVTVELLRENKILNINNCVYEMGSLSKIQRRVFIAWIVNQDYQSRYNMGLMYGIDSVKKLPMVFYVFEEATTYFGSWSLKRSDPHAGVLYEFITVGRNYGLRSFLVVNREKGSLSTDIRDISPKVLGYVEAESDLRYYAGKSKALRKLVESMPKYNWVYYNKQRYGPFRIMDKVKNVPKDFIIKQDTRAHEKKPREISIKSTVIMILLAVVVLLLLFR